MDQEGFKYVTIHSTTALAEQIRQTAAIEWDEEEWHYSCPNEFPRKERVALYILALDAINFCFWPLDNYEYDDLARTLTNAAQADHNVQAKDTSQVSSEYALSPTKLKDMTVESMSQLFRSHHPGGKAPPDIENRCRLWNEVGRVLLHHFHGSARNLIERANGSAVRLVELLIEHFDGFCDYHDNLYFLKRAQICVGDWNAALQLELKDMDQLTTFADYRVPQLLRHVGVLEYNETLASQIDDKQEIAKDSPEETSIRAATVVAVEQLVEELKTQEPSKEWTAVQVDWYLWYVSFRFACSSNVGHLHFLVHL